MTRRITFLFFTAVVAATAARAQLQIGLNDVYTPVTAGFQNCLPMTDNEASTAPVYHPAPYGTAAGELRLVAHGNCARPDPSDPTPRSSNRCSPNEPAGDALFAFKRATTGVWTVPSAPHTNLWETWTGPTTPFNCGTTQQLSSSTTGMLGDPAVIGPFDTAGGPRHYMAFLKGNGDAWTGEIWWAVSSNGGDTWSVYPTPILYAGNHRFHRSTTPDSSGGNCAEGFGRVTLAERVEGTSRYFYIMASYHHPGHETGLGYGAISDVTFRFRYDSAHTYGFSSTTQIADYNPATKTFASWKNWTGPLKWKYDGLPAVLETGELDPARTHSEWGKEYNQLGQKVNLFMPDSVTYVPSAGKYVMLIDEHGLSTSDPHYRDADSNLPYMSSTDLVSWSGPYYIDIQPSYLWKRGPSFNPSFPATTGYGFKRTVDNGIWYGTLGGVTGLWGLLSHPWCDIPLNNQYDRLRVLPVRITGTVQ